MKIKKLQYRSYLLTAFDEYAITNSTRVKSLQKNNPEFYQNRKNFAMATMDDTDVFDLQVFGVGTGKKNNLINQLGDLVYDLASLDKEFHCKFKLVYLDKVAEIMGFKKRISISDKRKTELRDMLEQRRVHRAQLH